MLRHNFKVILVGVSSSIALPYFLALVTNLLYGWPPGENKLKRALHPRKVMALNYAIFQQVCNIRFLGLLLRWKYFYITAPSTRIQKDIAFGSRSNTLDIYYPLLSDIDNDGTGLPVLVFVYGGSWSSGDKSMYGLLASQLADKSKSLVCCINYSLYPKGCVDDQVQDVVDALTWIRHNIYRHGGNMERIGLIGHSAGGHLVVMAVLEIIIKRLIHQPHLQSLSITQSSDLTNSSITDTKSGYASAMSDSETLSIKSFNQLSNTGSSFVVLDTQEEQRLLSSQPSPLVNTLPCDSDSPPVTGSFYIVSSENGQCENKNASDADDNFSPAVSVTENTYHTSDDILTVEQADIVVTSTDTSVVSDTISDHGNIYTELPRTRDVSKEQEKTNVSADLKFSISQEFDESGEHTLSQSQREVNDMLTSIKVVIGLAGVYQIGDHYQFETYRGIQDISAMCRVMYGPDRFERFSPTCVIPTLPSSVKLPPLRLLHGQNDEVVPFTSSVKLGEVVRAHGHQDVRVVLFPGLYHKEICLDLMQPEREWYAPVMDEILRATNQYL